MLRFCEELEHGCHQDELPKYRKLVKQIAAWYQDIHSNYADMLKMEQNLSTMSTELSQATDMLVYSEDLSYNFSAKLSYFSVSDTLVKLILSSFSYGATPDFLATHGIQRKNPPKKICSWLADKDNEVSMTEILAKVLRDSGQAFSFDLQSLLQDRGKRGGLTHASQTAPCLSAIRSYNSIRAMLVYLDEDYENKLPPFVCDQPFSYDTLLAEPSHFNFTD